jgi:hypothetical protein
LEQAKAYNVLIRLNVCELNMRIMITTIFIFCLLAGPSLAAFDDGNTSMMPTLSQAWGGLPAYLKEKITWVIGLSIIGLVVVGILFSLLSGGHTILGGLRGDVAGRSTGISNMILGIGVIFVALITISIIFWLVS